MPLPKVSGGESEQDYISRCIAAQSGEDKPDDQKAAICYSTYREAKKADGLRDNVEKAALAAGVGSVLAKSLARDAVHSHFQVQKALKVRSLAHLVKTLALGMVSQVEKNGKPIGAVSQRQDGEYIKTSHGWERRESKDTDERKDPAMVNLPLNKRPGGDIDSQIDQYKRKQQAETANEYRNKANAFKQSKVEAQELYQKHGAEIIGPLVTKLGKPEKEIRQILEELIRTNPEKFKKAFTNSLKKMDDGKL